MDDPTSRYLTHIRALDPVFANAAVERITAGQYNDILILDSAWVFRFPRYAEGVQALAAETALLRAIKGRLPLPIPNPRYARFDPPEPGAAFMGYPRLPGEPLYPPKLRAVRDPAEREALAGQLADFLRALHAVAPAEVGLGDAAPADGVESWSAMYADIRAKLFPAIRPDARARVAKRFEGYLGDPALQAFTPTLRHGDFGGSNILFEQRKSGAVITGVLDFAFCAPGDPAADLASVSTLGASFFDLIAERYEPDDAAREPLLARARFYRDTFALTEALAGLRDGDDAAYRSGMADYI